MLWTDQCAFATNLKCARRRLCAQYCLHAFHRTLVMRSCKCAWLSSIKTTPCSPISNDRKSRGQYLRCDVLTSGHPCSHIPPPLQQRMAQQNRACQARNMLHDHLLPHQYDNTSLPPERITCLAEQTVNTIDGCPRTDLAVIATPMALQHCAVAVPSTRRSAQP